MLFNYQNTSYFSENFSFEKGRENENSQLPAMLLSCGHNQSSHYPGYFFNGQYPGILPSIIWQYTLSGEGILEYEDKPAFHLVPGTLMLLFTPHNYCYYPRETKKGWEFIFVCMNGASAIEITRNLITRYGPVHKLSEESSAVAVARELLAQANEKLISSPWTAAKLAFDLIMETGRDLTNTPEERPLPFIRKAFEYCASHADGPLNVGDLAKAAGYSKFHFVRQFKKHVGIPPSEYIREVRLCRAHKLLQMTPASIKEIADACGFISVSHFSRAFRSRFGFPPGKVRQHSSTSSLANPNSSSACL